MIETFFTMLKLHVFLPLKKTSCLCDSRLIALLDFVFLYVVNHKCVSLELCISRSYLLCVVTQEFVTGTASNHKLLLGGYFHGRNDLTYGVDIDKLRWLGVLQVVFSNMFQKAFVFSFFLPLILFIWHQP